MLTDWMLVRRLGAELEVRLRGARVQDVGLLPDGRPAMLFWSRGVTTVLAIDAFGNPPAITLEPGELAIEREPGFVRAARPALVGATLLRVQARHGDRLLRLSFGTRSRFGIGDELDLYVELVPRFGNAVLVKHKSVVAALKEFSPAQNRLRAVQVGVPYEMPPLPDDRRMLPKLIAESGADATEAVRFLKSADATCEPLYVYRRGGKLAQAHLFPLAQFADAVLSREPSLLDLLAEDRAGRGGGDDAALERRRVALIRRVSAHERKIARELESLTARRRDVAGRERLREEGGHIYATLHELDNRGRNEAKERAAKLFARYRKLGSTLPHLEIRERILRTQAESLETLRWEAQRTSDEDFADVEAAFEALEPRRKTSRNAKPPTKRTRKRRKPLEQNTPSGSRILVGRSPSENAELTFRMARPNDLWFHARGTPGAHVILQRDDRQDPPHEDIELAAALAAAHSKARGSGKVPVDYALRKHVRKQSDAPPGLVFYTNAQTITVEPLLR